MARPTELTFERVAAAADVMVAKGVTPTVDALRDELGGSDSTISRYLRLWKEQRATPPSAKISAVVTPEVTAMLQGWANGLLARAQDDHDAKLSAERAVRTAAEQTTEQRSAELEVMRNAVADLEKSLRQRDDQVIKAQDELKELMSRLALSDREKMELATKLEDARRDIAAAEQRAALAEQKAHLVEQMALTAPTRVAGKDGTRGARTDTAQSA